MENKKKEQTEEPKIYAIKKDKDGITFSRKDFLSTLGVIGAGTAISPIITGCSKEEKDEAVYERVHTINGSVNFNINNWISIK